MKDAFGLPLTTTSPQARDHYVDGVHRYLCAQPGVADAFRAALAADPTLALAHIGLAREAMLYGDRDGTRKALGAAQSCANGVSDREAGHIKFNVDMLSGKPGPAFDFARTRHLRDHPRDAMVAQACSGVFGLIGFSGRAARDAEQLAFTTWLEPDAGQDAWFATQHGFAQLETGLFGPAHDNLSRAYEAEPRSGHTAHILAHLHYETGDWDKGRDFLNDWMAGYSPAGAMWCHNSWHVALWQMETGQIDAMWDGFARNIAPGTNAPPLNVLTDAAALLFRAHLAGVDVGDRWQAVSDFAQTRFAKPGMAFADVHAALAHAMAGQGDRLAAVIEGAKGPVAAHVRALAHGFGALADQNWGGAVDHLNPVMADHVRIGGSNAQRDMIECALAYALVHMGKVDEAWRMVARRRPNLPAARLVEGLGA